MVRQIRALLIANRGEIACRVMRTARRMGIKCIAVYSDEDKQALHVSMADQAIRIGTAPSTDSYLCQQKIIEAAKLSQADAIHPGYGFLSENAEFAEFCVQENVIFVGPPAKAIKAMGLKDKAKEIMRNAGVPVVPGWDGSSQDDKELIAAAENVGYPLVVKAVRGGGGKGMRVVRKAKYFQDALNSARLEAKQAFGDQQMILEKWLDRPRHVEVQIFSDTHDNHVWLWERDCSLQRRHQKVIEEAPAPGLTEQVRRQMGETATRAAQAVGYVGAGTVEFIFDTTQEGVFYFMEMNTRLQVEHPVTEMITGLDLVEWQLKVASGEQLPLSQESVQRNGHAIECRLYAEDPMQDFLPGAGKLLHLTFPKETKDLRVETGVRQGDEVSVYYDPMIAKIAAWGLTRQAALNRLFQALLQTKIYGPACNLQFLRSLISHEDFVKQVLYTGFIADRLASLLPAPTTFNADTQCIMAAALLALTAQPRSSHPFHATDSFQINVFGRRVFDVVDNAKQKCRLELEICSPDRAVLLGGDGKREEFEWSLDTSVVRSNDDKSITFWVQLPKIGRCVFDALFVKEEQKIVIFYRNGFEMHFALQEPSWAAAAGLKGVESNNEIVAPMPGLVKQVNVKAGDSVKAHQALVMLVAMKMEHVLRAPFDAIVQTVSCAADNTVSRHQVLVVLQPAVPLTEPSD